MRPTPARSTTICPTWQRCLNRATTCSAISENYLRSDKHSDLSRQLHDVFMGPQFADLDRTPWAVRFLLIQSMSAVDTMQEIQVAFLTFTYISTFIPHMKTGYVNLTFFSISIRIGSRLGEASLLLTHHPENPAITVEPKFNRLVIMESTDSSFRRIQADRISIRSLASIRRRLRLFKGRSGRSNPAHHQLGTRERWFGEASHREKLEPHCPDQKPVLRQRHARRIGGSGSREVCSAYWIRRMRCGADRMLLVMTDAGLDVDLRKRLVFDLHSQLAPSSLLDQLIYAMRVP